MEYVYSIMMFCMAGGLLLYAGLLALAKDPMLIPKHWAAKMDNKKILPSDRLCRVHIPELENSQETILKWKQDLSLALLRRWPIDPFFGTEQAGSTDRERRLLRSERPR